MNQPTIPVQVVHGAVTRLVVGAPSLMAHDRCYGARP